MILVTGATGLVGANLLLKLSEKPERLRALYRSAHKRGEIKRFFEVKHAIERWEQIEWVKGDVLSIPDLEAAFEGVNSIFHCAAMVSFDPRDRKQMYEVNVVGTANVVNLSLANKVEYLCHVSSVAALGSNKDAKAVNEETQFDVEKKQSYYAHTKYLSELEIWRAYYEGLACSIVNPSVIISDHFWGNSSGTMIPMVAKGLPFYTSGSTGFVWVQDLVDIMINLAGKRIAGERFVVNGDNLAYRDFFARIAHRLSVKAPRKSFPKGLGSFACFLDALRSKLTRSPRKLTKEALMASYKKKTFDASKVESWLNFSFTPMDRVLDEVCQCYKNEH